MLADVEVCSKYDDTQGSSILKRFIVSGVIKH
jgi:hypothetical protein